MESYHRKPVASLQQTEIPKIRNATKTRTRTTNPKIVGVITNANHRIFFYLSSCATLHGY